MSSASSAERKRRWANPEYRARVLDGLRKGRMNILRLQAIGEIYRILGRPGLRRKPQFRTEGGSGE